MTRRVLYRTRREQAARGAWRRGADKSDLPFKYICDTEDDHFIAGEGYARALRKGPLGVGVVSRRIWHFGREGEFFFQQDP